MGQMSTFSWTRNMILTPMFSFFFFSQQVIEIWKVTTTLMKLEIPYKLQIILHEILWVNKEVKRLKKNLFWIFEYKIGNFYITDLK